MDLKLVQVEGIGFCKRIPLGVLQDVGELAYYAHNSGFPTVEAWVDKIKSIIPLGSPWFLYRVEVFNAR